MRRRPSSVLMERQRGGPAEWAEWSNGPLLRRNGRLGKLSLPFVATRDATEETRGEQKRMTERERERGKERGDSDSLVCAATIRQRRAADTQPLRPSACRRCSLCRRCSPHLSIPLTHTHPLHSYTDILQVCRVTLQPPLRRPAAALAVPLRRPVPSAMADARYDPNQNNRQVIEVSNRREAGGEGGSRMEGWAADVRMAW